MSTPPPFLSVEARVAYLERKSYLFGSEPTQEARERLNEVNFHYLLGYARNYRMLAAQGSVPTDDVLTRVFSIVDADRELAVVIFDALRQLEWKLRSLTVEHHCAHFPTTGCFLRPGHYRVFDPGQPPVEVLLEKYIRRSREPYLIEHFDDGKAIEDLPLWTVVDTWTFGGLSRFICESGPAPATGGPEVWLWKQIATALSVSVPTIQDKLRAITVLRNLVAHHGRLWMRPHASAVKFPKVFPTSVQRSIQPRSTYMLLLAVAEMLGPRDAGNAFLDRIDAILDRDTAYALGIKTPIAKSAP